jgi:ATP synthase protein I
VPRDDDNERKPPWWSEQSDEDAPLPDRFPERPDQARVDALREKLSRDRAAGGGHHRTPLHDRLEGKTRGRSARDIGTYTLIPMMMLVGPVIGFLAGHWVEGRFGGAPWPGVVGVFVGLAAAVRQIILMLQRRQEQDRKEDA